MVSAPRRDLSVQSTRCIFCPLVLTIENYRPLVCDCHFYVVLRHFSCGPVRAEAAARLLAKIAGPNFSAGDNAYGRRTELGAGTGKEFGFLSFICKPDQCDPLPGVKRLGKKLVWELTFHPSAE